jgi:hypothetical protein
MTIPSNIVTVVDHGMLDSHNETISKYLCPFRLEELRSFTAYAALIPTSHHCSGYERHNES